MCNGGDVAGMTTGDDCAVAAVGGVVAAGGIAMAVGTAIGGGDLTTLRFGGCPLWSKALTLESGHLQCKCACAALRIFSKREGATN